MLYSKFAAISAMVLAVGVGAASVASGAVLYSANGFEAPGYVANQSLVGQSASAPASDQWNASVTGGYFATVIQYASSTLQGVALSATNTAANDVGFFYPNKYTSSFVTPGSQTLSVGWTQLVAPGATNAPFFGVTIYGSDLNTAVATAGFNATTGQLIVQSGPNSYVPSASQFVAQANVYYNLRLDLNYGAQSYQVVVNGVVVDSLPFGLSTTTFGEADLLGYNMNTSGTANGVSYFDNYTISIPEPAGVGSISLIVAVAAMKRNRR